MRKVRIQSPLDRLPLHVKQTLRAWLTTGGPHGHGVSYKEARRRLADEYHVKTSPASLCAFFHRPETESVTANASVVGSKTGRTITVVIHLPE